MDIKPNSINAVIYFTLYICAQDKEISQTELIKLIDSTKIVMSMNATDFSDLQGLNIEDIVNEISADILGKKNWLTKTLLNDEKKFIHHILNDPIQVELALRVARIAASIDGLHDRESYKFSAWVDEWKGILSK
tara:strand:- start:781 stop:1182 length:402 start_codon:yes stop_codon:yes gene_type:complete